MTRSFGRWVVWACALAASASVSASGCSSGEDSASGQPGDLYISVRVKPHAEFERVREHLAIDMPITFSRAAIGGEVEVPLLGGGHTRLKVPSGTQSGEVLVLEGMGLPSMDHGGRGDLHVRVHVFVPKDLAAEEKRLLEEFDRLQAQKRPGLLGKFKRKLKRE